MMTLAPLYLITGLLLACFAWQGLRDPNRPRRKRTSLFWGLLSLSFLVGERLPAPVMGAVVLALAVLAGLGAAGKGGGGNIDAALRKESAERLGNRLFGLALLLPALTLVGVLVQKPLRWHGVPVLEPSSATLLCLGLGCGLALLAALRLTGRSGQVALSEGRRLLDAMGWAATLPMLLSTLGGVFAAVGVGGAMAELLRGLLPLHLRAVAVVTYALGMALLTILMGNAFAAFPILTAGIGVPILVQVHHADPAPLGALGMLSGYCGTLLSPMAANFNLVPAALLELGDSSAVIKAQAPTALLLLLLNVLLMNVLLFSGAAF